tara:strand:- start:99 stop:812 length:714 start_codon:yes stop_codon:yes gene_type:complete
MKGGKVLVDGDIIAYQAAASKEKDLPLDAINKVDELMEDVLENTCQFPVSSSDYIVYLTGSSNFRYEVAKAAGYKANRKDKPRPRYLGLTREYLVNNYGAITSKGEEADDLIGIAATKFGPTTIVASIDKDMLQLPCYHYNFTKGWSEVDEWSGTKFFYTQLLTGDVSDNIKGVPGIGPKKADKLLEGCVTEHSLWDTCLGAYGGDFDLAIENARLLWLRREEGEMWEPPVSVDDTQ